jgi:hypothetical protein
MLIRYVSPMTKSNVVSTSLTPLIARMSPDPARMMPAGVPPPPTPTVDE